MTCTKTPEHLGCTACSLATAGRRQPVGGHGNPLAKIACVAEAPGAVEDRKEEPLVGPAGRHFDKVLEMVGLDRQKLYLSNVVHCKPPNNSLKGYPDAVLTCPPLWLLNELRNLPQLRVIVAMGQYAGSLWFPGKRATELAKLARAVTVRRNGSGASVWIIVGAIHPSYAMREGAWADELLAESLRRAMRYAEL